MPDAPALAVVVPTLNEERSLPALLASLAEGPAPDELVVVDGGSSDGTVALAGAAGATVVGASRGRGSQLRAGARATTAELLLFLHADTRVGAGALTAVRAAFADPEVIATGMRQRVEAEAGFYRLVEGAANLRVRLGRVYGDSGLAVRRAAYERVGGFRDLPLFEDLDLSRRLRRVGRIALVRDAELCVSARRWQREGALRRTLSNWILTLAFAVGVDPRRLARRYPAHSEDPGAADAP